ncbi:MAG TPA: ABC transporter permease [Steroidobacteraceae bacterium]|jgi:putative ABC transport system permease protein
MKALWGLKAMLEYYIRLAWMSFRRNPVLSSLIITAIALGVSMTMTAFTILYVMSGDPIPSKSRVLFAVQLDNGGPQSRKAGETEPATQLTYRDAMALLNAHVAQRQVAMHQVSLTAVPANPDLKPFPIAGRATSADFFDMFEVPMLFGRGWGASNDVAGSAIVVLSKKLNERLFNGLDSVGKSVRLDKETYQVVGVTDDWDPKPRFYDVIGGQNFDEGEDVYLPLSLTIDRQISTSEYEICNAGPRGESFADLLQSECVWLQFWAELSTREDVARYSTFLQNYSREQQRAGRFKWEPNIRLLNVRDWLVEQKVVPNDAKLSVLVAFGFFIVCLVSALGLMLAKSFGRSAEFGVRRALGASSRALFTQTIVEAGVIGLLGGLFGLGSTVLELRVIRELFPGGLGRIAQMDAKLLIGTVLLALAATVITGIYPAWRSMQVAPALQLKGG